MKKLQSFTRVKYSIIDLLALSLFIGCIYGLYFRKTWYVDEILGNCTPIHFAKGSYYSRNIFAFIELTALGDQQLKFIKIKNRQKFIENQPILERSNLQINHFTTIDFGTKNNWALFDMAKNEFLIYNGSSFIYKHQCGFIYPANFDGNSALVFDDTMIVTYLPLHEGYLCFFDCSSGKLNFSTNKAWVPAYSNYISRNKKYVASLSSKRTLHIWSASSSGIKEDSYEFMSDIDTIEFSSDITSDLIALAVDKRVIIFSIIKMKIIKEYLLDYKPHYIRFSPSGNRIFALNGGNTNPIMYSVIALWSDSGTTTQTGYIENATLLSTVILDEHRLLLRHYAPDKQGAIIVDVDKRKIVYEFPQEFARRDINAINENEIVIFNNNNLEIWKKRFNEYFPLSITRIEVLGLILLFVYTYWRKSWLR